MKRGLGRWWVVSAVLALGGCQCLEPVAELTPDGGADAGRPDGGGGGDAGSDGGAQGCATAGDCAGAVGQSLCSFGTDAGYSCIDRRCVFECSKGRSCTFDAGASCLDCSVPATTACLTLGCGAAVMQGQVEATTSSCQLGFTDLMLTPKGGCQWAVSDAAGAKGTMTHVGSGQYVGQFTGLGTCVGVSLFTQVERVLFSCEGCQFVLRI